MQNPPDSFREGNFYLWRKLKWKKKSTVPTSEYSLTRTIKANWTVKFYAPTALTITQRSATAAVQESGTMMPRVTTIQRFVSTVTIITTPVARNAMHLFTTMMLMSTMMNIFVMNVIREYAKTHRFTNTVTSPNLFSTVILIVISVLNWKSTEQARTMIMLRNSLILAICMTNISTSKRTVLLMMVWR